MKFDAEDRDEVGAMVDMAPLVDVVFLLLIFFMVTATFQIDERDLSIAVPAAENGNPLRDLPETLVVGVRKDGSFSVGSTVLDRESLRAVLVKAKRKNERQRVIVRADRDTPFRHPVDVLDLCTGIGIETSVATADAQGG
ncbi:MAG: biopolymer transporter ExbD [Planctomycetota bacterium]